MLPSRAMLFPRARPFAFGTALLAPHPHPSAAGRYFVGGPLAPRSSLGTAGLSTYARSVSRHLPLAGSPLVQPPSDRGKSGLLLSRTGQPLLAKTTSALTLRRHASSPSSGTSAYFTDSFSRPLGVFVHVLSRLARTVVAFAFGIAAITAIGFEGVHWYLERRLIPSSDSGKVFEKALAQGRTDDDTWGWAGELIDDAWCPPGIGPCGTDPKLGWRARHAVRGAWYCARYGKGLHPSVIFTGQGTFGHPSRAGLGGNKSNRGQTIDEGFALAASYLELALKEANKRGISLGLDPPSLRALPSRSQCNLSKPHPTAVVLETRMAACHERVGTVSGLDKARAGYERLFAALRRARQLAHEEPTAASANSNASNGPSSGAISRFVAPDDARMARLATKIGDLHMRLGRREDAEKWFERAASMAGGKVKAGDLRNAKAQNDGDFVAANRGSEAKPTPALTRSLVGTLLSLSALYALPPRASEVRDSKEAASAMSSDRRASLERAVRTEAAALRLVRGEKQLLDDSVTATAAEPERNSRASNQVGALFSLVSPATLQDPFERAKALHRLALEHDDALVSIHLAETLYALKNKSEGAGGTGNGTGWRFSPASWLASLWHGSLSSQGSANAGANGPSLAWLSGATTASLAVLTALSEPVSESETKKKATSEPSGTGEDDDDDDDAKGGLRLRSEFADDDVLRLPAGRLLRDARRAWETSEELSRSLTGGR